jgi:hypothetical protein
MTAPTLTRMCEGSYEPVTEADGQVGVCPVCGLMLALTKDGLAGIHNRVDLLAMVGRGDFG